MVPGIFQILYNLGVGNTTSINNTAIATASSPGQTNNVSDTSDDGDDTDGNTVDDSTVVPIYQNPVIEATKTVSITDNNGNGTKELKHQLKFVFLVFLFVPLSIQSSTYVYISILTV